jgi:O-antigen/teichoic acid export membrane protein
MKKKIKEKIRNLVNPGKNLSDKVAKGAFWIFLLRIFTRSFSLLKSLILARLLSPKDFGLFGIALLTFSILENLSNTGFNNALIQKKGGIKNYLDSAWTVQILRETVIANVIFWFSPYISIFFNEPGATNILRALALGILIKGFVNIGVINFQKDLEFNKNFIYELSAVFTDVIFSISMALILKNVWALVIGYILGNVVRVVVSFIISETTPKISFDIQKVSELFSFGKWILASNVLVYILTQGDDILVGKLLGATSLGVYQMAYKLSNLPATEWSHLVAKLTYPAYSKLQNNVKKMKKVYMYSLKMTAFLSFPVSGAIFIFADPFTKLILGEKWLSIIPIMKILSVYGLLRSIGATTGVIFMALGKPEIRTRFQLFQVFIFGILIYPGIEKFGLHGASYIVTFYSVFNYFMVFLIYRILNLDIKEVLKANIIPLSFTIITMLTINFLKINYFNMISYFNFIVLIFISITIYVSLVIIFDKKLNYNIKSLIINQLKKL